MTSLESYHRWTDGSSVLGSLQVWRSVSPEAIDLLQKLLTPEVEAVPAPGPDTGDTQQEGWKMLEKLS